MCVVVDAIVMRVGVYVYGDAIYYAVMFVAVVITVVLLWCCYNFRCFLKKYIVFHCFYYFRDYACLCWCYCCCCCCCCCCCL